MNWTEDSWTRQENVIVRVLGAERLAYAFTLAFEQLWERGDRRGTGRGRAAPGRPRRRRLGAAVVHAGARRGALPPGREAPRPREAAHPDRLARAHRGPDPRHARRGRRTSGAATSRACRRHAGRRGLPPVADERRQRLEDPAPADDRDRGAARREAVDAVDAGCRPRLRCTRRSSSPTTSPSSARSTSRAPGSTTPRTCSRSTTRDRRRARRLRRRGARPVPARDAAGRAPGDDRPVR